jgi:hypothetical protein
MNGVWRMLHEEVYACLHHRPHFFLDLVDPATRSQVDILAMIEILPGFESHGPATLGLNGNEANILARLLGLPEAKSERADCARLATDLRQRLGISTVVIHQTRFAVAAGSDGSAMVSGPHCARPLKSTGAGDRFNAGYCLGLLAQGTLEDCLALGCASSGFFVREARSAGRGESRPPVNGGFLLCLSPPHFKAIDRQMGQLPCCFPWQKNCRSPPEK